MFLKELEKFVSEDEFEAKELQIIKKFIKENPDNLTRNNEIAHITVSAWITNSSLDKVLMIYHNIYDSWSWVGGHADGETDLLAVAMREVKEETGIKKVCPVTEDIFSLESLTVDGHIKNGSYISSHLHLNITYLLEADSEETVSIKEDENSGVAWFAPEEALKKSSEPWFVAHIYKKLLDKMDETGRNVR